MTNNNTATIRRTVYVAFDGMGTKTKGWGIYMTQDGSRFDFYKTRKEAEADAKRFGIKII